MGSQSISEMLYTGRSSPDSWSPALDHDGLVAWPRPRHTPSTSDRSPSLPSDFLEDAPPRRLVSKSSPFIFGLGNNARSNRLVIA